MAESGAHARLATIASYLTSVGITYERLVPANLEACPALGLGIWMDPDNPHDFVVVSTPTEETNQVFVTGGALLDVIPNERLALLEVCNYLNSREVSPTCYLDESKDWSLICKTRFPLALVEDLPQMFLSHVQTVNLGTVVARNEFLQRGLRGKLWRWETADLFELLSRSTFPAKAS